MTAFHATLGRREIRFGGFQSGYTDVGNRRLERESGKARLEEAVAAYQAALEERTRERVPLQWAMTQTNLAPALAELGVRTQDRVKFEEAREAVSGAFEVYMQAGQEDRQVAFENLLRQIDEYLAHMAEAPPS